MTAKWHQDPAILDVEYTVEDGIEVVGIIKIDGTPVDWTTASLIEAHVRRKPRTAKLADLDIVGHNNGTITFRLDTAITTSLGEGTCVYSIRATFDDEEPLTYLAGELHGKFRATHTT